MPIQRRPRLSRASALISSSARVFGSPATWCQVVKRAAGDVEMLQAVAGAEPEAVLAVVGDGQHVAVAVAAPGRFVARQEAAKRLGCRVVQGQAAVGADPQAPLAVHAQHADIVAAQRGRVADDVTEIDETVAVEARQAVLGAEPHEAVAVLGDRQHRFLGQAVLDAQVLETQGRRRRGHGRHRRSRRPAPAASRTAAPACVEQCGRRREEGWLTVHFIKISNKVDPEGNYCLKGYY